MKSLARILSNSIFALLILVTAAGATQIIFQTLNQLGNNASAVVQGQVAGVRSYWNDSHTKIFTETTINIDEAFKGQPGGTVRVVQLGGTVDNIRVTAHGALQWKQGEEIILFLEDYTAGTYQVSGFSQGKFQIERDARTGAVYVLRPPQPGVEFVGVPGDKAAAGEFQKMALEKFMDEALGEGATSRKN